MPDTSSAPFAGKVALVTGAAQGIGEATARLFAERGAAAVFLTDRQADKGEAVAASLRGQGIEARFLAADLADAEAAPAIVAAADAVFGRVDILANVAGLTDRGSVFDTDLALWDKMFAVNVRSPFFLMQGVLRLMEREKSEGAIVNVISVNAHVGAPHLTPYSASKGALATLTLNVANVVAERRVRVNGLNIGWVDTPGEHATLKRFHNATENWLKEAEASRPWGRLLKPLDVARAIGFLAGPESGIMTGSVIDFDQVVFGGRAP